jgi:hypothetical protein
MAPAIRSDKLIETAESIRDRIDRRFRDSGLREVVAEAVVKAAQDASERAEEIAKPNRWLRAGLVALVAIAVGGVASYFPAGPLEKPAWREVMEFLDTSKGGAAILTAAAVFLFTLENRIKRSRALGAIHELRGLAHLIDMYQLGKDPTLLGRAADAPDVAGKVLDADLMRLYLHHCIELLAVVGKLGQLYVQDFPDAQAVAAVDDYEDLASGLSSKIWQKLMFLDRVQGDAALPAPDAPAVALPLPNGEVTAAAAG